MSFYIQEILPPPSQTSTPLHIDFFIFFVPHTETIKLNFPLLSKLLQSFVVLDFTCTFMVKMFTLKIP